MTDIIICKRCVMDSTDPLIKFDEHGYCNYCNYALATKDSRWKNTAEGKIELDDIVNRIKKESVNKKYDCIIGLSGGLDSSYLAYYMKKEYNLRMLAVHIDTGWNTKLAENNISKICKKMDIELITERVNQDEFMDLQRSYFLSGVPSQDNPQDNIFLAALFKYAIQHKIKYFLSGANFSTESILQKGYSYNAADNVNLLDIHKHHGTIPLKSLYTMSLFDRYIKYRFINKIIMVKPLDLINYNLNEAIDTLKTAIGFEYYGGKHYESFFTRFFQEYYLPVRFNFDKRKSHLSSLIISNQLTRDDALNILKNPPYDPIKINKDIDYLCTKLKITRQQFEDCMKMPLVDNKRYKFSKLIFLRKLALLFRRKLGE